MNGIIKWMTEHPVAAHLSLIIVLLVGLFSLTQLPQTTFPEFALDTVEVSVGYQGAAPGEIDQSIIRPIEDQLAGIDGIDEITATAREGLGTVSITFHSGEDIVTKLGEVQTEIDRITVFPEDADEPTVVQGNNRSRVLELAIHGAVDERVLKEEAERLRDELSALDAVSFVETANTRDYEISIEIDRDTLNAYGMTLSEVARIVGQNSLELPGGSVETDALAIPLRTTGRNYTGTDFETIIIRSNDEGAQVRLGDVATVIDGFADTDLRASFAGQPAATVNVFRVGDEQVLQVVDAALAYAETTFTPTLPQGVNLTVWQNEAIVLQSRLDLLVKNAFTGMVLVILCLALFLDIRLAFWSAVGIGVAFAGSFTVMGLMDLTINMISLFGFILAIGIVVDNAIVVSENIYKNGEQGAPPMQAAVKGAQRVAVPVIFSALTTIVAFFPLLAMPGVLGNVLGDIPRIVIIVLVLSLIQALVILPHTLSRLRLGSDYRAPLALWPINTLRGWIDAGLQWFIRVPLDRTLRFTTRRFIVPIAGVLAAMILAVGLVAHGYVKFEFFPSIDGEYVTANIEMVDGTTLTRTQAVAERLRVAAVAAGENLSDAVGHTGGPIVENVSIIIGRGAQGGGPDAGAATSGAAVGHVVVKVTDPELRDWPTSAFEAAWNAEVGDIAGIKSMTLSASLIDAGDPIALELSLPDGEDITPVIDDLRAQLRAIPGVFGIQDDNSAGRLEYTFELREEARLYGVTLSDLATQMRNGFFGVEATRVQRGRDDVQVRVRFPQSDRDSLHDLMDTRIRTAQGALIPLSVVAEIREDVAPTQITRRDGRTITSVTADIDVAVTTAQQANDLIRQDVLPALEERYRGLIVDFGGEQRTQSEAQAALGQATAIAMIVIFALLALIFRSYVQPIVVMLAIPLGLVGAVVGHYLLGVSLGLLSIFGVIGLAGVVINNSLVMIDLYNEYLGRGMDTRAAVIKGTKDRFRPILLTSMTTFLGIFPLIMETSVQAQFLIPLAVSIGFGVLFGTVIMIMAVPSFFIAQARLFGSYRYPASADAVSSPTPASIVDGATIRAANDADPKLAAAE